MPSFTFRTVLMSYRGLTGALFMGACMLTGCSSSGDRAGGEFYSYVDAQGNVVMVAPEPNAAPAPAAPDSLAPVTEGELSSTAGQPADPASTPDQLWGAPDEAYLSSDQIEQRIQQRDRERFVSYPDEQGRLTAVGVDMVAARELAVAQRAEREQGGSPLVLPDVGVRTGWSEIPLDCCVAVLEQAAELEDDEEKRVRFSPASAILLDQLRPARAFRLAPGMTSLIVQSWDQQGYQWPGLVFLDASGRPLEVVDNLFTRVQAENWHSQASVSGTVDITRGSAWAVLYLGYARSDGEAIVMDQTRIELGEQAFVLSVGADTVIRGRSARR